MGVCICPVSTGVFLLLCGLVDWLAVQASVWKNEDVGIFISFPGFISSFLIFIISCLVHGEQVY